MKANYKYRKAKKKKVTALPQTLLFFNLYGILF